MKLLLDEMISPQVARELRARGHYVEAIKRDRPELEGLSDQELVARMASEQRAMVTNDVADFRVIHDRLLAQGGEHYGLVFTFDATLPRARANLTAWVGALESLLLTHPDDAALRNRITALP